MTVWHDEKIYNENVSMGPCSRLNVAEKQVNWSKTVRWERVERIKNKDKKKHEMIPPLQRIQPSSVT